jgi:tRNA threonylcarbamoyladenosine biosynthesis protein TsaE
METHICKTAEETINTGRIFGKILNKGMTIALTGPLGAGKTVFVKGIALSMGITENITSPSFTIMSVYQGKLKLYHIDLYRINDEEELEYLGITDIVYTDGISVIEWGEKAQSILPDNTVFINIAILENGSRKIEISGNNIVK